MTVVVKINGSDVSNQVSARDVSVSQILGTQRDTARLTYKKYGTKSYTPAILDTVLIQDGATDIFGGRIIQFNQTPINGADGIEYTLDCTDYSIDLDSILVSQEYVNKSVQYIINDFCTNFATGFTCVNVNCTYVIADIVFNQITISQALKQLADLMKYNYYIDASKDIHFFPKYNSPAPFNITDSSGNYVATSLQTASDGSQIANSVKVRGGNYQAPTYSDTITVKGSVTKSWVLPYTFVFSTMTISINSVSKTIGIYGTDDFVSKDVLYKAEDQSIQVFSALADGSTIAFSGVPLIPVLAVASDPVSIATYGVREKIIQDSSIIDLNVARTRAIGELAQYKDPKITGSFDTYTAGLRSGQVINLNSSRRGINTDFIIRSVTYSMRLHDTMQYHVELVTSREYTLIEMLQSILQVDTTPLNPNEKNEIIKVILEIAKLTESITLHSSPDHSDVTSLTISESIGKDPIGAGVSPIWVLGPWYPSGLSDTKRVVVVNQISAILY